MGNCTYKQSGKVGFFDKETTSLKMSKLGNTLEKLHKVIDFEMFRIDLEDNLLKIDKKSNAGCKPYDVVLMFKIILLKRFYNLSDEQAEYQINDRLSFKEFLGLSSGDRVPDARTIWLFQDNLIKQNLEEKLFEKFHNYLDNKGLFVNEGKIVDASFVEVPRQRNKKEENEEIKSGKGEKLWKDKPHKKCQKDIDARWTEKGGEKFYGYKDHTKIDTKSKLIDTYEVTSAEVHDSQALEKLVGASDKGQELHADSAYTGEPIDKMLKDREIIPQIIERAFRGKPLTEAQREQNHIKSKVRSRVEHVFGFVSNNMNDFYIQSIGFQRVKGVVGLINLVYNMCRYEQIVRLNLLPIKD
ncbi:MAG: IS5 family transposase [Bacteroidales bacterium]|jgi:IS5 family transposase|nr:IS5 family transposase [Bacteroidales bacterium]